MRVVWNHTDEGVEFLVHAPTRGWVAIGFNGHDGIVGADLFMASEQSGVPVAEHHRVVAPGEHPRVERVGGRSALIRGEVGFDERGHTVARLVVDPAKLAGAALRTGVETWLVVAFSVEPEFDHHSRMRRHVPVTL